MKVYRLQWVDPRQGPVTADYMREADREKTAAIIRKAGIEPVFSEAERSFPWEAENGLAQKKKPALAVLTPIR